MAVCSLQVETVASPRRFHSATDEGIDLGISLNVSTVPVASDHINQVKLYASLLKEYSSHKTLYSGKRVHAYIIRFWHSGNVFLETLLVHMYGKCGALADSKVVFNTMQGRNIFSFNMIVDAYLHCGKVADARKIFDRMVLRDVVSWNTMIAAYAKLGQIDEALSLFKTMLNQGAKPNRVTYISILNAFCHSQVLAKGRLIHSFVLVGGVESHAVGNAIVHMYAKCDSIEDARSVFDNMRNLDVVSFSTLIVAYIACGNSAEAIKLFQQSKVHGLAPDNIMVACILDACAAEAELAQGKHIHAYVVASRSELDIAVGNALVDMYGKCGSLDTALDIFQTMKKQDVVTWTSMLAAYAYQGCGEEVLHLFGVMQLRGHMPNDVTYMIILSACSHAGCLDEAEEFINNLPMQPTTITWLTLLGACQDITV